jgi:CheY-like chemotaxis protein
MSYILVVEDNPDHRDLIRLVLGRSYRGIPVRMTASGEDALELMESQGLPRIALVDVNMPGLSGHATVRRIREGRAGRLLPVVMLSTSDEPEDVRACLEAGANSYVRKPLTLSDWGRTMGAIADYWLLHDTSAGASAGGTADAA